MRLAFQTVSTVAVVLLLGASTAHSQSLGDVLGKAKEVKDKMQKTKGGASKNGDAKNGDAKNGDKNASDGTANQKKDAESSEGSGKTVGDQQQHIRAMTADKRPVEVGQRMGLPANYAYRQLTVNDKFPIKFTCDDAAVKAFLDENQDAWTMMNEFANDLETQLHYGSRASYLKTGLGKVKEIHVTTTTLRHDANNKGGGAYLYSFNPATGVLTAAKSTSPPDAALEVASDDNHEAKMDQWILAHMTAAPKMRAVDNSVADTGGGGSSGSSGSTHAPAKGSQTKKWTCTWCHETVEAAARPSLAGCPRNKAGQHAWHN